MKIHFWKYQATGNDFILLDNRDRGIRLTTDQIIRLCDRKFGIGADGLMLIEPHSQLDFTLQYFNSDGSQSLCGNGSRAAVNFAASLGMVHDGTSFEAYDGRHDANQLAGGIVRLQMNEVREVKTVADGLFVHTGSPHVVRFVDDVQSYPVFDEGRKLRYSEPYQPGGTNVNFVQLLPDNTIHVRTYERGVENETLSCGTGVTAAAIAASTKGYQSPVNIKTPGGTLSVEFTADESGHFNNIFLIGPAILVFEGTLEL